MAKLHHHLAVSTRRGHAGKRQDAVLVPKEPDMQRIVITAALVAGFAGSALAESPLAVPEAPFASTKTRAEVQAELADFQRGGVNPWSTSYNPLHAFRSSNTREAVTAEYVGSRNQVHAMNGEDSGSQWLRMAAQPSPAARTLASR
jgi:hypothetical protein